MSYDSLVNHGDYLSAHYLAEMLPKHLKAPDGLLARWSATENERKLAHERAVGEAEREGEEPKQLPEPERTPRQGVRGLRAVHFAHRTYFAQLAAELAADPQAPLPRDWVERRTALDATILHALGFTTAEAAPNSPRERPRCLTVRHADREVEVPVAHAEPDIVAVSCGWTASTDAALAPEEGGALLHPVELESGAELVDGKELATFLFAAEDPPRYVLLLCGSVLVLADRLAWGEGRYLAVNLDLALDRMDDTKAGELDTIAALFSADALRVPESGGGSALDDFARKSTQHAVGVSTELRDGVRTSVELIANEVLTRLRQQGAHLDEFEDGKGFARRLTRESLRYVYRILFLLYAEARPELGILPADHEEYAEGYGLQRLGELASRDLVGERSRGGFHFYASIDLLCRMVCTGHRELGTEEADEQARAADEAAQQRTQQAALELREGRLSTAEHDRIVREAERERRAQHSATSGLRFEPLHSDLFSPDAIELIGDDRLANPRAGEEREDGGRVPEHYDTRLRNEVLHTVLRNLMLTKGRKGKRGGFISYAQLGINQLGAVYEGLMSYTGFIAEDDLYEVAKDGDRAHGSWMIPVSQADQYDTEVFVREQGEEFGVRYVRYPRGSFVYRLAGRDRQTSASYYTPESLTQVTVELALRELMKSEPSARDVLNWTICEPALGSGAFLNEAINQVAAKYLSLREKEIGRPIDPERRPRELQKAKAYVALHNAYGVDLNATAVELAEVSLWLNTMHPGMKAPWYGLHLRRGNSLIGCGRRVYDEKTVEKGSWLLSKGAPAPQELPFRDGPLPDGAIHHFLLPTSGWGAVAGEAEARSLAPQQTAALKAWRRGIQKRPGTKKPNGKPDSQLRRLQRLARQVEFLWGLVGKRLSLSEQAISRRIDVWEADWLEDHATHAEPQEILNELLRVGAPYWRLKTVMDAWCALWFLPLDEVPLFDGTAPQYPEGDSYDASVGAGPAESADTIYVRQPSADGSAEPIPAPAPLPQVVAQDALFADERGEQLGLEAEAGEGQETPAAQPKSTSKSKSKMPRGRVHRTRYQRRSIIPLRNMDDWLDFAEALLGTGELSEFGFQDTFDTLDRLTEFEDFLVGAMCMDIPTEVFARFPWLSVVEELAGANESGPQTEGGLGFLHWELQFAHIFQGAAGGFDLQVGNPPWVRPRWEEDAVLAELDPWFKLAEKPGVEVFRGRKEEVLGLPGAVRYFLKELTFNTGLVNSLASPTTYSLLGGTQPNVYRAFMCTTWRHLGQHGSVALIHPNTHLDGVAEGELRAASYHRLRVHANFINVGNWAFEAARTMEFGLHIYGAPLEVVDFACLNHLTDAHMVATSLDHDGEGELPGQKLEGTWDQRPHGKRVIQVNAHVLEEWARLVDLTDSPADEVPLLRPLTAAEQGAMQMLAIYDTRLSERRPRISSGFHEKGAKEKGLIKWGNFRIKSVDELVLQGTYFSVATPFAKSPRVPCIKQSDWDALDPRDLPPSFLPVSNYVRACSTSKFHDAQDRWLDEDLLEENSRLSNADLRSQLAQAGSDGSTSHDRELLLQHSSVRRYSAYYRLAWRMMIPFNTERSLFAGVIPPGPTHIHGVNSMAFREASETVLVSGYWASLPLDYILRVCGRSNLGAGEAQKMPTPHPKHPLAAPLQLRALRLNCLTDLYASLWAEVYAAATHAYEHWALSWPSLSSLSQGLQPTWHHETPLRTEYERRAALVEIDALVAVWLRLTAEQLAAIYTSRYGILSDRESRMWFDANGRQIAQDPYAYGHGQTKQDFLDFLAYQDGTRSTPPEGYTAPFYKADRVREMTEAHAVFSERLRNAEG